MNREYRVLYHAPETEDDARNGRWYIVVSSCPEFPMESFVYESRPMTKDEALKFCQVLIDRANNLKK